MLLKLHGYSSPVGEAEIRETSSMVLRLHPANGTGHGGRHWCWEFGVELHWDNGKENGNYYNGLYRVYIGVILGLYWGYIGVILGLYWGHISLPPLPTLNPTSKQ